MARRAGTALAVALVLACAPATPGAPAQRAPAAPVASLPAPAPVEARPEHVIESARLADPALRTAAIQRLETLLEGALWRSRGDRLAPEVRAMIAAMVAPLVAVYLDHAASLDGATRSSLGRLLGWMDDPRVEPAVKKAFESFAEHPHANPMDTVDLGWAARAAGELDLAGVREPMLRAFVRYSVSKQPGGSWNWDLCQAMVVLADPAWAPTLLPMLDVPMVLTQANDEVADAAARDQLFRQMTAAEVLGALHEPRAARPLMRALLDPAKMAMAPWARLALVKLGEPAEALGRELLSAGDTHELVVYARSRAEQAGIGSHDPLAVAGGVLAAIGRPEALGPLLNAISKTTGFTRVHLATDLPKLPARAESKRAFRAVFETMVQKADRLVPTLHVLADAAAGFADPELVDWLLAHAARAKGGSLRPLRSSLLMSAVKLALPEQFAAIERSLTFNEQFELRDVSVAKRELETCGRQVTCHLAELTRVSQHSISESFAAIKACYMLAILGDARTRDEIIERIDRIRDQRVAEAAALAIDHLSPDGSLDAAQKIEAIVRRHRFDPTRLRLVQLLDQLSYRLRARVRVP